MRVWFFGFILMIFPLFISAAEPSVADSLLSKLEFAESDSARVLHQIALYKLYEKENGYRALEWAKKAYELAKRVEYKNGIELSLGAIRSMSIAQDNYSQTYWSNNELEIIYRLRKDTSKIFECIDRLLIYNRSQDDFVSAKKNLKELEDINQNCNNQYFKDILIHKGNLFWHMGNIDSAEFFYLKLNQIAHEEENDEYIRIALNNLGAILFQREDYTNAKDVFLRVLEIKAMNPNADHVTDYMNLSSAYYEMGMDDRSKHYDYKAMAFAKKVNRKGSLEQLYGYMIERYEESKTFDSLLHYTKLKGEVSITLKAEAHNEKVNKLNAEKQHRDDVALLQKREKQKLEKIETRNRIVVILLIGFGFIMLFSAYYYKRSLEKRKIIQQKNLEIDAKKKEVEAKNKSFILNFEYAKSIQEAVLPGNNLEEALPESFVFYRPKDIVSGDFYWVSKTKSDQVLIAVGDCTGHGVPGGLMSIMGTAFINELVSEKPDISPSELLNDLRLRVIDGLQQKGVAGEARDGMDISLCLLNTSTLEVIFAGAYNPLYIIRERQLLTLDADAQPVGYFTGDLKPFNEHKKQLNKGDVIYMSTDGYQDQFGGDRGKKFMKGKFKKMLVEVSNKPLNEQRAYIDELMKNWMSGYDQIDDMCLLGFKV